MTIVLVSATTSAFARLNRVALIEKNIAFELQTEVPWNSTTKTPGFNPLEKLPILILDDGSAIYNSAFIQEFIVQKYAHLEPKLLPNSIDAALRARQVQSLAEGHMDAIVLSMFEKARQSPSAEWQARQDRKVDGGLRAYAQYVQAMTDRGDTWLIDDTFSIADIAVGCAVGWIDFFGIRPGWKTEYAQLAGYWHTLSDRESFKLTTHSMPEKMDKIV